MCIPMKLDRKGETRLGFLSRSGGWGALCGRGHRRRGRQRLGRPGQPTTTELLGPQPYLTVHEAHHTTWAAPQQPITTTTNHWENRPYNLHSPYRGQKSSNWETFNNGYCFSNWCHLQCYGIFVRQGAGPLYLIYLGGKVESERKGQSRPWKSPLGGRLWKSAPS